MKLLKGLNLRHLSNALIVQFLHNVLKVILDLDPIKLKVKTEYDELNGAVGKMDEQFKTDKGSDKTDALIQLDALRDRAYCGIRDNVKSHQLNFEPKKEQAANTLFSSLSNYGTDANRLPFAAETAVIDNLHKDWSTKLELKAAVTELGLDTWIAHLKAKNVEFDTLYVSRSQEMGAKTIEGMKKTRAASMEAYNAMKDMFESQYKVNKGAGDFVKALSDWNGVIATYNNILSHKPEKKVPQPPTQG